jgi:hypothetical protein
MINEELNSNGKLALAINGMEGTGDHFLVNGESARDLLTKEKQRKFNDDVAAMEDKFAKHQRAMEEYAAQLSEDMNGVEIMPMFNYVLIKPFDNNPFQQIKIQGSIITDLGGYTPTYKSNETGKIEEETQFIKVGTVVETGHKCEFIKPGDVVFYTIASECMVPFFKLGFVTVAENRILAVVNADLTKRREELRK